VTSAAEARGAADGATEAIERLARYFGDAPTRQGILARAALGRPAPDDTALAGRLADAFARELRPDGTVAGGAAPTIWRVHELLDLGCKPDRPDVARAVRWLLERQDAPGAYGEGCGGDRHQRRVCSHFVGGFFSAAPPEQRIAPITMPNGKVFRAEPAARFAVSCLAFRAAARAGRADGPAMRRHAESLVRLAELWGEWDGYFSPDLIVAGLHALASLRATQATAAGVAALALAHQSVDGTWPNVDLLHVCEALLAVDTAEARLALRRAAPALRERQRADGTFGATARQERALIGLRALLAARDS
jgi:hypothetical protein